MKQTAEQLRASKSPAGGPCESCKHYRMIDSGHGYCVRYPPKLVLVQWFPRILHDAQHPHVAWCELACGEFRQK